MKSIYGFIVWFIATLFVVYSFCLNTAAAVFSDAIKTSLHATSVGASLASSAFILGFALMQIPAGYLLDKLNARYVVSAGILVLAVGNVITSYAGNLVIFSISNFIQGVGASFSFVAAAVLISQWFSPKSFPVLFGLTQALSCILAGIIHYYFTLALSTVTWNVIYHQLSLMGFGLLVLSILLVKSPADLKREAGVSLFKSLSVVCGSAQIWLCAFAAALSFGVLLSYASFWYFPVQLFYSVTHIQSVITSAMIFVGIGIGTPILGWYSNILKSRMMVIHVTLVVGVIALMLGIYLPHYNFNTLVISKVISFCIGFFLSGSMLFYTIASEISSNATRGVAISVVNTTVFLFNTLMLFVPYLFITQDSKQFFTYLWMLPVFVMISILLIYFIKDSYTQSQVN